LRIVKGPDFPTAGIIHGKAGILDAYKTGRGRFTMRAKAAIENINKDRQAIIVTEIPYQVNKRYLIERMAELVNNKTIEDISDIRDESDRDGMRIVIELKRGAEPQIILNQLFKHTQMQENFSMILLAVVHGQPKEMGLIPAIQHFIEHRVDVVRRRTAYLLQKAKDREHILEGYLKALDHLDNVIAIIRGSANRADARENLVAYFGGKKIDINTTGRAPKMDPEKPFTAIQADAILELQLHRLTRLSIDEITKELNTTRENIAEYESILGSEKKLRKVIVSELEEVKKQYGDERRTVIEDEAAEIQLEDLIADEQVAVTVSHGGYLKRTPISTYRQQRRGGQGRTGMKTRDEDFVEHLFIASTHAYILIFTNTGRVYWLKVYEIPDVGSAGKGKAIVNLANLLPGEEVRALLSVKEFAANVSVVMATRNGTVKKTSLENFSNPTARGIIAMGVPDDDQLIAAEMLSGDETVFIGTHDGMCIRFHHSDVREMGRQAYGVIGIRLDEGDYVVAMIACTSEEEMVLTVTEGGFGKRTSVEEYRPQGRGGKGIINVRTTDKNGKVVAIMPVNEDSDVLVMTANGKLIRVRSTNIRAVGRATQGVRLIQLDDDDKVTAATLTESEGENGNGNGTGTVNGGEAETPPTVN